jgi:PPM family protein phosphatase
MTGSPEEPTSAAAPPDPEGTPPPPGPLRLRYAAVSDVGRHRKDNQDSGFASERLLVVADGVGGQAFGDVASSTAVHLLRRLDSPDGAADGSDSSESLSALAGAVHRVHDRLAEMVEHDSELDGTSTTLTAALFDGRALALAHIGDSRAYLLRNGGARQLTADHTFVQTLIDEGRITEEEARVHPQRNIILKAVDAVHESDPDLFVVGLEPGDRLMLCSDGCSGVLSDAEIARLLGDGSVDFAAVELVRAALDAGSTDNVTVVAAEVVDAAAVDDPESAAVGVGPMLVGAAAAQPRRGVMSRIPFRGRPHDTGELDPVDDDVDPEELRYAPQAPRRLRGLRLVLLVLLPLLLLVGAAAASYSWSQQQYYVGSDGPHVAVFRGVQVDLPGLSLSEVHETSSLQLDALTPYNRRLVDEGIVAESLGDARSIVDNLEDDARQQAEEECAREQRARERERDRDNRTGDRESSGQRTASPDGDSDSSDSSGGSGDSTDSSSVCPPDTGASNGDTEESPNGSGGR